MTVRLSLVIPCFNEGAAIPALLERCRGVTRDGEVEVILVDNGSTDDTPGVLARLLPGYPGCRSLRVEVNRGYGFGILAGLAAAEGEVLGWTHADLQTDPEDVLAGLQLFRQHGDGIFVKGRRYGRPLADVFFTACMGAFESLLLGKWMWDINAQPTMFSRAFYRGWRDAPHDFSLDLYVYYQARRHGIAVHRFPVRFGERAHGRSHWNVSWSAKRKFIERTVRYSLELKKSLEK